MPSSREKKTAPRAAKRGRSLLKLSRRQWLTVAGLIVFAAAITCVFAFTELDFATVRDATLRSIEGLNPILLFLLMATLPVAGFSVGLMYLVAGARFGPLVGGAGAPPATAIHLLATHWISRSFLRAPLERFFARRKHRLPEIPPGEEASISVMAALVPGPPYFARNYLLALSGIPLRVYFWICLPIYVARSYITIFLGDLTGDPNGRTLFILIAVYAVKVAICAYLIARFRRRHKSRVAAAKNAASQSNAKRNDSPAGKRDLIESA
jgi:uncharacterized membrane protein YdjX (TVP38/TMEM64 family)